MYLLAHGVSVALGNCMTMPSARPRGMIVALFEADRRTARASAVIALSRPRDRR